MTKIVEGHAHERQSADNFLGNSTRTHDSLALSCLNSRPKSQQPMQRRKTIESDRFASMVQPMKVNRTTVSLEKGCIVGLVRSFRVRTRDLSGTRGESVAPVELASKSLTQADYTFKEGGEKGVPDAWMQAGNERSVYDHTNPCGCGGGTNRLSKWTKAALPSVALLIPCLFVAIPAPAQAQTCESASD